MDFFSSIEHNNDTEGTRFLKTGIFGFVSIADKPDKGLRRALESHRTKQKLDKEY